MRREQRIALSALRHHGHIGFFEGKQVLFTDHHQVEVVGEYDEAVISVDSIKVLKSDIPEHEAGAILNSHDDGIKYKLGLSLIHI